MAPIATSPVRLGQESRQIKGGQSIEEVLYQEATKAFLTRQYGATNQALKKLLALLPPRSSSAPAWYERAASTDGAERSLEGWRTKTVKLSITHYADLYDTSPPAATVPEELRPFLAPEAAHTAIQKGLELCKVQWAAADELQRVPATMMATLAMASLKLGPEGVSFVKKVIEDWLASLPQELESALGGRKVEGVTEDYLKVVELYVGEILTRDGEWEMASMFLETEPLMSSKRKESLFLKLRSLKLRAKKEAPRPPSPPSLLSASMELPPSSPTSRSRSSSSSSERTARPGLNSSIPRPLAVPDRPSRKGKERAVDVEVEETDVKSRDVEKTTNRQHPTSTAASAIASLTGVWAQITSRIPPTFYPSTKRPLSFIPLSLGLSLLIFILRRRTRRPHPGQATTIRDRLRMRHGWRQWLLWWLLQSWQKTVGVLKSGTTITYI